jgi:hypothetical protein
MRLAPQEGVPMLGVVSRLGDRLLQKLVPKTTASACGDASVQAEWFVACYCGDIGSPPPGNSFPCRWIGKICGTCGGTSYCGKCGEAVGGNCCT